MSIYLVILITILFSAFFSGMEIAFISSSRLKIELEKKKGSFSGKIVSSLAEKPSNIISTLLIGNTLALVVYGVASSKILEPFLKTYLPTFLEGSYKLMFIQSLIATTVILFIAEFLPKVIFSINPNRMLQLFGVPLAGVYYLLFPVVKLFTNISVFILRYVFRVKWEERKYTFTPYDLDVFVKEFSFSDENNEENRELQMFQNAIELKSVILRECMVPRTEIVALDLDESVLKARELISKTGHSKILVFQDNIDNIIGYVHSFDLFKKPATLKEIIRPAIIVNETLPARQLMQMLIHQHKSLAVVVDEYGGTSGIVTLEDVIEEFIGEISDEHDIQKLTEKRLADDEYLFSARLEIDYLNKKYFLSLPESTEYETLGGLITSYYESIPSAGDVILIENFECKIVEATQTRVETVRLKLLRS